MRRPRRSPTLILTALALLTSSATAEATAAAAPRPAAPPAATAPATMFEAVQRDLGLTAEQARDRLAVDGRAREVDAALRARLGAAYAGSWLPDGADRLTVAISDARQSSAVTDAGATPVVVRHSAATLASAHSRLDRARAGLPASVTSWYVDAMRNRVVVTATDTTAAARFVAAGGVDPALVEVRHATARPRKMIDIRGGEGFWTALHGCSIGFAVNRGYITAGHCDPAGTWTIHANGVSLGAIQAATFDTNGDYAWVATTSDWTPQPLVTQWNGTDVTVAGAMVAPIRTLVCRSGATTGWHCGLIDAFNVTVNYSTGETIGGLTRTTACADHGDSGGPFLAGPHAQGVLSGGSGDCVSGGDSYFQPVGEILSAYGLELTVNPPQACGTYPNVQTGSIPRMNASAFEPDPDGAGFQASAGTHRACLTSGGALRLELQYFSLKQWRTVATSDAPFGDEHITYSGAAGKYRYRIVGDTGGAGYTLGYSRP
ncbi:S1 family peptidase [Catellatospora sp. KI3]|uniref:S1 family peptidase n=1 Tax=Catellatospora sp. KI3 TaxID=3041620 RepID=UPI0024832DC8|nr:S1 family peptidase [Catellatospora sp. KI3]MDI1461099.1 S1 family peptidase [Catellatospora sp. KI3]